MVKSVMKTKNEETANGMSCIAAAFMQYFNSAAQAKNAERFLNMASVTFFWEIAKMICSNLPFSFILSLCDCRPVWAGVMSQEYLMYVK